MILLHNAHAKQVVTPRFVPTCSSTLMRGLAALAARHNALIQSHVAENRNEIAWVRSLHADCASYTDVYDKHGLLTNRARKKNNNRNYC